MISRGKRIKLIVDLRKHVSGDTVNDLLGHIQGGRMFALCTTDERQLMVFDPARLCATESNKDHHEYDCMENFVDAVKLTLIAYPVFISLQGKIQNTPQKKLNDRNRSL